MGSFYVRKNKVTWSLMEESWEGGNRIQKRVPPDAYGTLGFRPEMTIEEAKERARILNRSNTEERLKQVRAVRRAISHQIVESKVLPASLVEEFIEKIEEETFGSDVHTAKLLSQFKTVQELLKDLEIEPHDIHNHAKRIYKYFVDEEYSLDYSNKLLRILNEFGKFVCRKNKIPHEPVEAPRGKIREVIKDTYFDSDTFQGTTEPLLPAALEAAKPKLTVPGQYEWLFISIWFGLRATEVDGLKKQGHFRIEYDAELEVDVLYVYQTKLTSLERDARWKPIPVIYPEQKKALEYIKAGTFARPIYKTLRKAFDNRITLRSGRRGFTDLMLGLGQQLDDIAIWLGHATIDRTWKHYKNRRKVSFTKPKKSAS
jgi:hypothetical protein